MDRLAIDGGEPVQKQPLPGWPFFAEDEVDAAAAVLRSGKVNYWTGGEGRSFEQEFAPFVGCEHAVALANGTVALELALYALGIGPGDEVIVTSRTFVASASCIVVRGATPVMADVDRDSQNITADTVRAALTPKTKAILAVHLAGWPCDLDPILDLARERGLPVVEDCAQALGARYRGRPVGSLADVAAFSFCQDKILTTAGEGGMLVTNDLPLWKNAWSYKDHGKNPDAYPVWGQRPASRWVHDSFGTNGRLSEVQSAVGRVALRKVPEWVETRRRNAAVLTERLARLPALRIPVPPGDVYHAFYKYYVFVRPERMKDGWDRDRVLDAICAEGVPCSRGTCSEIYLDKAFGADLRPRERLPVAKELGETALMFLVHPTLSEHHLATVGRAVEKVLAVATR